MIVGEGMYRYRVVEGWGKLPEGWNFTETEVVLPPELAYAGDFTGVYALAVDSEDRVHVSNHGVHPVIIFDRDGNFQASWGEGLFSISPHGLLVGADSSVYCVNMEHHNIQKFTSEGNLLLTRGDKDQPSDTGYVNSDEWDYRTIKRSGPPFRNPTDLAVTPTGEMYVTDGYGNARVHKFSADGTLLFSWGEPGSGPGEFNVPHGIVLDSEGRVYVADCENNRIQIFSPDGDFITEWTGVTHPLGLAIDREDILYVAEWGYRYGLKPDMPPPSAESPQPGVSIWSSTGELLTRWGGEDTLAPGNFCLPHAIGVDSRGDIYVGDFPHVPSDKDMLPPDYNTLQKFARVV